MGEENEWHCKETVDRVRYFSEVHRKIRVWWEDYEFESLRNRKEKVICSKSKRIDLGKELYIGGDG